MREETDTHFRFRNLVDRSESKHFWTTERASAGQLWSAGRDFGHLMDILFCRSLSWQDPQNGLFDRRGSLADSVPCFVANSMMEFPPDKVHFLLPIESRINDEFGPSAPLRRLPAGVESHPNFGQGHSRASRTLEQGTLFEITLSKRQNVVRIFIKIISKRRNLN